MTRVIQVVEAMEEKGQQVKHVDLVDDVKPEEVQEEVAAKKLKSKKSSETAARPKKD